MLHPLKEELRISRSARERLEEELRTEREHLFEELRIEREKLFEQFQALELRILQVSSAQLFHKKTKIPNPKGRENRRTSFNSSVK